MKPLRFMNRSGAPLRSALRQTDVDLAADLLLVTDDIDLPLGRLRLRRSGSAGGHNGLRDIIATFGTDEFDRLRVGVGRAGDRGRPRPGNVQPDERSSPTRWSPSEPMPPSGGSRTESTRR